MVLRHQGEKQRGRTSGEVVDAAEGEGTDDCREQDGREEGGVGESGENERLPDLR